MKNVTQQYVNNIKIKYQNYIYTKAWTHDRPSGNDRGQGYESMVHTVGI